MRCKGQGRRVRACGLREFRYWLYRSWLWRAGIFIPMAGFDCVQKHTNEVEKSVHREGRTRGSCWEGGRHPQASR